MIAGQVTTTAPRLCSAVVLNDSRVVDHHGCTLVMGNLESLLARQNIEVTCRVPSFHAWRDDPVTCELIRSADLVVVNGEGTIHHDRAAGRSLLEVAPFAKSFDVPSVLVNTLWQANSEEFIRLAKEFVMVAARDSSSAAELRRAGIDCRVVGDLSMYAPFHPSRERIGFGFTDSVDAEAAIRLDESRRQMGGKAVAIHFSHGLNGPYKFMRNHVAMRDIKNPTRLARLLRTGCAQYAGQVPTPAALLDEISSLRLLVSGRFHACTMAILADTPFVGAATNSHKISALLQDAGLEAWRDNMELTPANLSEAAKIGWTDAERSSVREFLEFTRKEADRLFRDIRSLV